MSNKTNQSVLVNDTSSYYLKQYAALQFPGSVDNFGTKTPIHLLQQQEESEHSVSLREACDSDYDLDSENFHKYRNKKVSKGRRSIRRQRYAIQPYDTVRLEGKTYITSGCHNKGTRLLIPANGKSKSVAISKVQVVCHAGAWIQII